MSSLGKHWKIRSKEVMNKLLKVNLGKIGEKAHNWRGGLTPLQKLIRSCFKNRQWISDVFTRDDYTCQICFKRGGDIEADHYPKMFSVIFRENDIKSLEQALSCEEFW